MQTESVVAGLRSMIRCGAVGELPKPRACQQGASGIPSLRVRLPTSCWWSCLALPFAEAGEVAPADKRRLLRRSGQRTRIVGQTGSNHNEEESLPNAYHSIALRRPAACGQRRRVHLCSRQSGCGCRGGNPDPAARPRCGGGRWASLHGILVHQRATAWCSRAPSTRAKPSPPGQPC